MLRRWRKDTLVAGYEALMVERSLLTAIDEADRRLSSRYDADEIRLVVSCQRPEDLVESMATIPVAQAPATCEPCGVWVSLTPVKSDKGK
jgi:hypothetical protein